MAVSSGGYETGRMSGDEHLGRRAVRMKIDEKLDKLFNGTMMEILKL